MRSTMSNSNLVLTLDSARLITRNVTETTGVREAVIALGSVVSGNFFVIDPATFNVGGRFQLSDATVDIEFGPYGLAKARTIGTDSQAAFRCHAEEQLKRLAAGSLYELGERLQLVRVSAAAKACGQRLTQEVIATIVNRENKLNPPKIIGSATAASGNGVSDDLIDSIVDDTLSAKRRKNRWNLDVAPPSHKSIASINELLSRCLFPGYFSGDRKNDRDEVRKLYIRLKQLLQRQIERAVCYDRKAAASQATAAASEKLVNEFFFRLPTVLRKLEADVSHAVDGDPAASSREEVILTSPGIRAITIYRCANVLAELKVLLVPRMMTEHAHSMYGIDIHPDATIGPGCFIDHGTGVTIGQTAVIGSNVRIYQGVTVGALSFDLDEQGCLRQRGVNYKRHPTIGDNVIIYANASVLGGETFVGANSVIGANVRLTKSVLPESIVTLPLQKPRIRPSKEECEDGSSI